MWSGDSLSHARSCECIGSNCILRSLGGTILGEADDRCNGRQSSSSRQNVKSKNAY